MQPKIRRLRSDIARSVGGIAAVALVVGCGSGNGTLELGQERSNDDEARITERMIEAIEAISLARAEGDKRVMRFNQAKTLGCFDGSFAVVKNLPPELRQGVFAEERTYPAQLRFASATEFDDTKKDFRGLSIKLHGVGGDSLWGAKGQQDFLLNSYPVLFAADPGDFLAFIEATRDGAVWRYFINPRHFYSLAIVLRGRERITDPLAIRYWSTTPYRYGADSATAVKYSAAPCADPAPAVEVEAHTESLAEAMDEHLKIAPACFDFMVQFQSDPAAMPIEDASVEWNEAESPFVTVAQLRIEPGETSAQTRANCEAMTFNPWQSLAAHRPLGGINRTRLAVYSEIGQFRQRENALRQPN